MRPQKGGRQKWFGTQKKYTFICSLKKEADKNDMADKKNLREGQMWISFCRFFIFTAQMKKKKN